MADVSNLPGPLARARRHLRLTARGRGVGDVGYPPFLTLFVNSICNLTCDHCFYWQNLNQRDDLTFDEMAALSADLGPIENLNLSGGEPFIRADVDQIVRMFIRDNEVKQVYVPSSGFFTDRTERALRSILEEPDLQLVAVELSIDGTEESHNTLRGSPEAFQRALATHDMLAKLQREDPRVRIHATSTVMSHNIDDIRALTDFLFDRCASMDHHNIPVIRGGRKDESLSEPTADDYRALSQYVQARWAQREATRFGSIVTPMLRWTCDRTLRERRQVTPCKAGVLAGVVYANGDVALCEEHAPIGNLRNATFRQLWTSPEADALRARIAARQCWCTNEIFMWPSVVFDPRSLARALVGSRGFSAGTRE